MADSQEQPKPTIGIDRLVYAPLLTDDETTGPTYGTSIALPGSVEITETFNADVAAFFADDGVYVQTAQAGQIQVPLTNANFDAEIAADLLGADYDASNGMVNEAQNDIPLEIAIGWRNQLPNGKYEYVWYMKGIFSKSEKAKTTKGESIEYSTVPLQFNAQPVKIDATSSIENVLKRSFSTDDPNAPVGLTDAALKSLTTGWFADPNIVATAPGTPVADFLIVTGVGSSGELDATWTVPTSATKQAIQIQDPVTSKWNDATTAAALTPSSAAATITGLTSGNTYTARLVVTSGAENGISNTSSAAAKV